MIQKIFLCQEVVYVTLPGYSTRDITRLHLYLAYGEVRVGGGVGEGGKEARRENVSVCIYKHVIGHSGSIATWAAARCADTKQSRMHVRRVDRA